MDALPRRRVVLCIDDEQIMLRLLRTTLAAEGHLVLTASSGSEALKLANSCRVDAVVLDYWIPGMNGAEIAAQIKGLQPKTAIVMYSGSPHVRPFVARYVEAFVDKAESLPALVTVLQRLLQPRGANPTAVRKTRRYAVELPFAVVVDRSGELILLQAVSTTLSEGGISGRVQGELVLGELALIQIPDLHLRMRLEPRAQVRYRHNDVYGFEFLDITPPQQEDLRRLCQRVQLASTFCEATARAQKWAQ